MDSQTQNHLNKDLILRERLAVERTDMAIDRTLLAFMRTALYFAVAGMTINSLLKLSHGPAIEITFWIIAAAILLIGFRSFLKQKKKLKNNKLHIGNFNKELDAA